MITLKKVTYKNIDEIEKIKWKSPEQDGYVASIDASLSCAYIWNDPKEQGLAVPYAIYNNDNVAVGFVMYGYFPKGEKDYSGTEPFYYIWRLLIDQNYQGKGYGKLAVKLILDEIKTKPYGEAKHVYVSYVPENIASKRIHELHGFVENGKISEGEAIALLEIEKIRHI